MVEVPILLPPSVRADLLQPRGDWMGFRPVKRGRASHKKTRAGGRRYCHACKECATSTTTGPSAAEVTVCQSGPVSTMAGRAQVLLVPAAGSAEVFATPGAMPLRASAAGRGDPAVAGTIDKAAPRRPMAATPRFLAAARRPAAALGSGRIVVRQLGECLDPPDGFHPPRREPGHATRFE